MTAPRTRVRMTDTRITPDFAARWAAHLNAGEWVERAACRGAGPRLWFPDDNGISVESKAAKAICAECPVQVDCREYGIEHEPKHGIWGGLAAKEHVAIRRKRRARDAHNAATRDLFDRIAGEVEAC